MADNFHRESYGFAGQGRRRAAERLIAALRREGSLPDMGPRAELAEDLVRIASLLDRAFVGPKPAWHGTRTNREVQVLLERAVGALSADLTGVRGHDWRNDPQIMSLLTDVHTRGGGHSDGR